MTAQNIGYQIGNQSFNFTLRDLFNALINGDRGYEARLTTETDSTSYEARAMLQNKGPRVLCQAPAVDIEIKIVPQAHDFVHAASESRMLPAFSLESTSGGWVALPYSFDPPPLFPDIIIPQAVWNSFGGETEITGLTTAPAPVGALAGFPGLPAPGFAYPAVIGSVDNVTSTGAL
jgi:hypothetical protein